MRRFFYSTEGWDYVWDSHLREYTYHNFISCDNPHGDLTINELDIDGHVFQLSLITCGAKMPVDNTERGQGVPGVPDVLSGKGGTADVPRGGVPGESGDEDGNAGALSAPSSPRHRGDSVGRKLSPPKVRPVRQ